MWVVPWEEITKKHRFATIGAFTLYKQKRLYDKKLTRGQPPERTPALPCGYRDVGTILRRA